MCLGRRSCLGSISGSPSSAFLPVPSRLWPVPQPSRTRSGGPVCSRDGPARAGGRTGTRTPCWRLMLARLASMHGVSRASLGRVGDGRFLRRHRRWSGRLHGRRGGCCGRNGSGGHWFGDSRLRPLFRRFCCGRCQNRCGNRGGLFGGFLLASLGQCGRWLCWRRDLGGN